MTSSSEERLAKRDWLINNFEQLLKQVTYYKDNKENFVLEKQVLWSDGEDEGSVDPI